MVRSVVGALKQVGQGALTVAQFEALLRPRLIGAMPAGRPAARVVPDRSFILTR